MKRITLTIDGWNDWVEPWGSRMYRIDLCHDGVRRNVALPPKIDSIDLVFTKTGGEDSFELDLEGRLDIRVQLGHGTRRRFADQFADGYRYVRVEVNT